MSESVDELSLDDILKFLWEIRGYIIRILIVILLLVVVNFILTGFRNHEVEGRAFSSANLDRVERGIYRVRVEVFGDRDDPIRGDTPVDFDRELNVTITNENDVLSFRLENLKEDIAIYSIRIQGRLRNRSYDDFYLVDTTHHRLDLNYNEMSRGVPLVAYTTDVHHNREANNWLLLRDIDEFRQYFELEFLEVSFYNLEIGFDMSTEKVVLRYIARYDLYVIQEDQTQEYEYGGNSEYEYGEDSEYGYGEDSEYGYGEDSEYGYGEDSEYGYGEDSEYGYGEDSDYQEDEDLEEEDEEPEEDDEEPEEDDETIVELIDHTDDIQSFTVVTAREEIILRIEHSDENWIGTPFYDAFDGVLEETLEVDSNGIAELSVSAIHSMDAMFINGFEIPFVSDGVVGSQYFVFNIEFV